MSPGTELAMQPRTAVATIELVESCDDLDCQPTVLLRTRALASTTPRIEATGRHLEHPTQYGHGIVGLLRLDEREPQWFRLAKKAVAFPKISTSISSRALSLRS